MHDYAEEFYRLSARNNLEENEQQLVARFVGGLQEVIQERLEMKSIWNLTEAINLATRFEQQLLRYSNHGCSSRRPQFEMSIDVGRMTLLESSLQNQKPFAFEQVSANAKDKQMPRPPPPKPNSSNPYARPMPIRCFQCHQPDHHSNKCPTRQPIHLVDGVDDEVEFMENDLDDDMFDGAEFVQGDDGDQLVCILQKILLSKQIGHSQ